MNGMKGVNQRILELAGRYFLTIRDMWVNINGSHDSTLTHIRSMKGIYSVYHVTASANSGDIEFYGPGHASNTIFKRR